MLMEELFYNHKLESFRILITDGTVNFVIFVLFSN